MHQSHLITIPQEATPLNDPNKELNSWFEPIQTRVETPILQ